MARRFNRGPRQDSGARAFERSMMDTDGDGGYRGRKRNGNGKSRRGRGSSEYQRGLRAGRKEMAAMLVDAPDGGYQYPHADDYNGKGKRRRDREVSAPAVRIGYRL